MGQLALAILTFALMIFFHELGHFVSAKLTGMEVKEFAIGFGKKLISKKFGDTVYSIRAIPLGGFNNIPSLDNDLAEKNMTAKSFGKRFIVLFMGSGANLLTAWLCLACMMLFIGTPAASTTIHSVAQGYAAESYLQPNDRILSINGEDFSGTNIFKDSTNVTSKIVQSSNLAVTVARNKETLSFNIPKEAGTPLGVVFQRGYEPVPVKDIVWATNDVYERTTLLLYDGIKQIVYPQKEQKLTEVVAGPIGVTQAMYKAQDTMGIFGLLFVFVLISINIGIFNLLPIPILDGGHIFLQFVQFISNGKLKEVHVRAFNYAGIAVLGTLFLLGTYADICRLIFG